MGTEAFFPAGMHGAAEPERRLGGRTPRTRGSDVPDEQLSDLLDRLRG